MHNPRCEVHEAFMAGVAQICARHVWSQVREISRHKKTQRYIRGEWREAKGVTQQQLAFQVDRDPSNVSRWFKEGSTNWNYLTFVMTDLDIEFRHFAKRLPTRAMRADEGRRQALLQIRIRDAQGNHVTRLTHVEFACLRLLVQSRDWAAAHEIEDADKRERQLKLVADSIVEQLEAMLDCWVELRTAEVMGKLQQDWARAWQECEENIRIQWSVE